MQSGLSKDGHAQLFRVLQKNSHRMKKSTPANKFTTKLPGGHWRAEFSVLPRRKGIN